MLKNEQVIGGSLAFLGAVLFAGKAIIIKWIYLHHSITTLPLLALRMIFSLPFYILILIRVTNQQPIKLQKNEIWSVIGIGILGYYLASYLDFKGLEYITATLERLILFVYPTLVLVISAIFLKKKISKIQVIALITTYIGVGLAFVPDLQFGPQKNLWLGSFLILMSALTYALYLIGSGQLVNKLGTQRMTSYAMIVSCLAVFLHYAIADGNSLLNLDQEIYLLCFTMAIFCTVIPSFLVAEGIKKIGSSNVAIISTVGPLATIILATQFLEEEFNGWHLVGTVFILSGVLIISMKKKEPKTFEIIKESN
jgi:drug/metabolite transporter (DMT)-like permease